MRYLLPIVLLLSGCATAPEPTVITKTEYITKLPPPELLVIPADVAPLNVDTATQQDAARYLVDIYNRMIQLESQLIGIGQFFYE